MGVCVNGCVDWWRLDGYVNGRVDRRVYGFLGGKVGRLSGWMDLCELCVDGKLCGWMGG